MSKNHRKKNRKPLTEHINCHHCEHAVYIGDGDYICDMSNDIIMIDWGTPTEDYYQCDGKDFEEI
jgi:hypothetical protein